MDHLEPALFAFVRELRANNDRDWFTANRQRYESDVAEPVAGFITAMKPLLAKAAPRLVADPSRRGGSMFRIYRDTRFSRDKSPYKDHVGVVFHHEQTAKTAGPGVYLHLAPDESFAAVGMHCMKSSDMAPLRSRMESHPEDWLAVKGLFEDSPWRLAGERLRGTPRGYTKNHPLIDDIRRIHLYVHRPLTENEICRTGFAGRLADMVEEASSLCGFICRSMDLDWE